MYPVAQRGGCLCSGVGICLRTWRLLTAALPCEGRMTAQGASHCCQVLNAEVRLVARETTSVSC